MNKRVRKQKATLLYVRRRGECFMSDFENSVIDRYVNI